MKELEYNGMTILTLFLEKLEKLTDREREVVIQSIEMINKPIFVSDL